MTAPASPIRHAVAPILVLQLPDTNPGGGDPSSCKLIQESSGRQKALMGHTQDRASYTKSQIVAGWAMGHVEGTAPSHGDFNHQATQQMCMLLTHPGRGF